MDVNALIEGLKLPAWEFSNLQRLS
jgi:hypothetical protein